MEQLPVVFTFPGYETIGDTLIQSLKAVEGEMEQRTFPDGEVYRRIVTLVEGRDVILVGGTTDDSATLGLYDVATAAVHYGAHRLTLVVPYFGYSTMERAVLSGEVVTAKTRARLLSIIPPASNGNRIFLLDLHSEGITHYFHSGMPARHLRATSVLLPVIRQVGGEEFVLGSTDAGRAKWVEGMANELGVEAAFIFKRRLSGSKTQVAALNAPVEGRTVVIYDDMIRTGGSLIGAAQAYRDAGATRLIAVCTHGVFAAGAYQRIMGSGLFDKVISTDSHPAAIGLKDAGLQVVPVAGVFLSPLSI